MTREEFQQRNVELNELYENGSIDKQTYETEIRKLRKEFDAAQRRDDRAARA